MQTTAIRTVAKSLPENGVILLTLLISGGYIPYTDLRKIYGTGMYFGIRFLRAFLKAGLIYIRVCDNRCLIPTNFFPLVLLFFHVMFSIPCPKP